MFTTNLTRMTDNSLNLAMHSGLGIFFIVILSELTLRHPWKTIFWGQLNMSLIGEFA